MSKRKEFEFIKCQSGKVVYHTKTRARRALCANRRARNEGVVPTCAERIYKCPHCHQWHLTKLKSA